MEKCFTQEQVDRALLKERLVLRVEQGEDVESVSQELGLTYHPKHVSRLRRQYAEGGRHWVALIDGRDGKRATQITAKIVQWLMRELQGRPDATATELRDRIQQQFEVDVSERYVRQLVHDLGRTGQTGRPSKVSAGVVTVNEPVLVEQTSHAGVMVLRGALWRMGIMPVLLQVVEACLDQYRRRFPEQELRVMTSQMETRVSKLLTLILLPCLSLERCYNLMGYQGQGLAAILPNGVHYKYGSLELFLNELARLDVGHPAMDALAAVFCQIFYPGQSSLLTYWDYCVKPLWTQYSQPKSKVTRIGRVMACTKMLFVHGPQGHPLYLANRPGDANLNDDVPKTQELFMAATGRFMRVCVLDREGNALNLALFGSKSHPIRSFLTLLNRNQYKSIQDFKVTTSWQPLDDKPHLEVAWAYWQSPLKRDRDPRRFFLVRPINDPEGHLAVGCVYRPPSHWHASDAYVFYYARWVHQEHRFREMHQIALSANYGYLRLSVPNRTAQRQFAAAQKRVKATQHQLATNQQQLDEQATRLAQWTQRFEARWAKRCADCQALHRLQTQEKLSATRRKQLARLQEECLADLLAHQSRMTTIQNKDIVPLQRKRAQLELCLAQRQKATGRISLDAPFYERNLNKDLVMMVCKMILLNAHYYVQEHLCGSEVWQTAEFATLCAQLYQKPGLVCVWADHVEVVLEPYRYVHLQHAAEETCRLFNAASLRDELDRRVMLRVAATEQEYAQLRSKFGQTLQR